MCSKPIAPTSEKSKAESLEHFRFRAEQYNEQQLDKLYIFILSECREREREEPLNPLSSLDLMARKYDWELGISIGEVKRRSEEEGGERREIG